MGRATWANATYKSIRDGLDELQDFFLSQELRKDHARPSRLLRSTAKAKAFKQRMMWILQEAMVVAGLFLGVLFAVVATIVWFL